MRPVSCCLPVHQTIDTRCRFLLILSLATGPESSPNFLHHKLRPQGLNQAPGAGLSGTASGLRGPQGRAHPPAKHPLSGRPLEVGGSHSSSCLP